MRHLATVLTSAAAMTILGCKPPQISVSEPPIKITQQTTGYGDPVKEGDTVAIDYTVRLPDGREILNQSSYRFRVGSDSVIRGMDEASLGMRTGAMRTFICPPHKHWGRKGHGKMIPPATDLTISMTLVEIEDRARVRVGVAEN